MLLTFKGCISIVEVDKSLEAMAVLVEYLMEVEKAANRCYIEDRIEGLSLSCLKVYQKIKVILSGVLIFRAFNAASSLLVGLY